MAPALDERVRVGILGCGNVGTALVQLIHDNADVLQERAGVRIEVAKVVVRDLGRDRGLPLPAATFTTDAAAVVHDPDVDIVVEVMGGIEPARTLIADALAAGKPVVTANKELVATHGREVFEAAQRAGVDILFEASVGGGIPLIRPLRESLAGDRIKRVTGIVNGTTNYILTKMTDEGASFADALREAQRLGFAEADPTADVEGFDAAAKVAIIASIAFGAQVVASDVYREGITGITASDIESAADLGYVVKLLAVAEESDGQVAVRDSFNAVFIEGEAVGELMLYGRGAGGGPTASAVLGDLVDAAKNVAEGRKGATIGTLVARPIRAVDDIESQYYLELEVADQPGVLAAIATKFGEHRVSIRSMQQRDVGDEARLIFVTHTARESDLRATVAALGNVDEVHRVGSVLRVVGED